MDFRIQVLLKPMVGLVALLAGAGGLGYFLAEVSTAGPNFGPAQLVHAAPLPQQPAQAVAEPVHGATLLQVPILNYQGNDDVCRTWIDVQSLGGETSKAVLISWDQARFCPPNADGPLNVTCSGLLQQGSRWSFLGAQIPTGSRSAVIYSFNTRSLSAIGVDLGFDEVVADYLCDTLYLGVVGDAGDYREFAEAYRFGGRFAGLPMDAVRGAPIAAQVLRHCPGSLTPGVEVSSTYAALPTAALGEPDAEGRYRYRLPMLYADSDQNALLGSVVYVQNADTECASIEVWVQAQGSCEEARICDVFTLAAGESYDLGMARCLAAGNSGNAWIHSTSPLAIVIDAFGQDLQTSYAATPLQPAEGAGPWTPASILHAPIAPATPGEGRLELRLHLLNLDPGRPAALDLSLIDPDGIEIDRAELQLCPRGSALHSFRLEGAAGLRPGRVRVSSRAEPGRTAPLLAGVLEALRIGVDDRPVEATAFELLPEPAASGQGRLVLPSITADLPGTGTTGEIALANLAASPGSTELAVMFFDANGLRHVLCRSLDAGQSDYIDLHSLGAIPSGFTGAALVSATHWTHDAGAPAALALAAVALARTGASLGGTFPGDATAASQAMPVPLAAAGGPGPILPPESLCGPDAPAGPRSVEPETGEPAALAILHAPVVDQILYDETCQGHFLVRNDGTRSAKVLALVRGEAGFCAPECNANQSVLCSGLLAPGQEWAFDTMGRGAAEGSLSLFSLGTDSLSELGLGIQPGERLAADYLCEVLADPSGDVVCDRTRRFRHAFRKGASFELLPLDRLVGPEIQAEIERDCEPTFIGTSQVSLEVPATTRYQAISQSAAESSRERVGEAGSAYAYNLARLHADEEAVSVFHTKNLGHRCASFEVVLVEADSGLQAVSRIYSLASGDAVQYRAADFAHFRSRDLERWQGYAIIRSSAPLAISVDEVRSDRLDSFTAFAGPRPFDVDENGLTDSRDRGAIEASIGAEAGDARWNPRFDLDQNGQIDEADLRWFDRNVRGDTTPQPSRTPAGPTALRPTPTRTELPTTVPLPTTATPEPTPEESILLPLLILGQ